MPRNRHQPRKAGSASEANTCGAGIRAVPAAKNSQPINATTIHTSVPMPCNVAQSRLPGSARTPSASGPASHGATHSGAATVFRAELQSASTAAAAALVVAAAPAVAQPARLSIAAMAAAAGKLASQAGSERVGES